jgi:hypothetical protein
MTTEDITDSVLDKLFSDGEANVYAVLDGASVADLLAKLYDLRPEFECLYRGELEPDMAEVAPYLVRLEAEAEFTSWVVEKGWGKHWGVFARSDADMRAVRRHLRTFLTVYDPDGKAMIFRYYDPRVMRLYLPTCNAQELQTVFGPVSCYLLEDEDPRTMLRFQLADGALSRGELRLEPEAG